MLHLASRESVLRRSLRWGLLATPLAAVAVVALLLAWGGGDTPSAEAVTGAPNFTIGIDGVCFTSIGNTSVTCDVAAGSAFTAGIDVDLSGVIQFDGDGDGFSGASFVQGRMNWSSGIDPPKTDTGIPISPIVGCPVGNIPVASVGASTWVGTCNQGVGVQEFSTGGPTPDTQDLGGPPARMFEIDFNCPASPSQHTVSLVHGAPGNSIIGSESGSGFSDTKDGGVDEVLTVNCFSKSLTVQDPDPIKGVAPSPVLPATQHLVVGTANFQADADADGAAGWSAVDLSITWPAALGAAKAANLSSGANATCNVDAPAAGSQTGDCQATANKGTSSPFESADPVDFDVTINCEEVGTHTITVQTQFTREDGSLVPPNEQEVELTCNLPIPSVVKGAFDGPEAGEGYLSEDGAGPNTCRDGIDNGGDGGADWDGAPGILDLDPDPDCRVTQVNQFLVSQSDKLAPADCQSVSPEDQTVFQERLDIPITSLDPKNIDPLTGKNLGGRLQILGAFQLQVNYNDEKVCVNVEPSPVWQALVDAGLADCDLFDSDDSQSGGGSILCVTYKAANKEDPGALAANNCNDGIDNDGDGGADFDDPDGCLLPDTFTFEGRHLANVTVSPQPELYSEITPTQNNGYLAQILDKNCNLVDPLGHGINSFSCDDATITFRMLEGDVDHDCDVDTTDEQIIAFRWKASQGSLLYRETYDLMPPPGGGAGSGPDGVIDVKDLQFVFGRHGSVCSESGREKDGTNPAQEPAHKS